MKKTTKGAVAAGAAAILLAGGAGTYAAWHDSASVGGDATITSGHLKVTEAASPTGWQWTAGGSGAFVPDEQTIVPGDTVTYTSSYTLDIKGTHITAEADLTTAGQGDSGEFDTSELTVTTVATPEGGGTEVTFPLEDLGEDDSGTYDVVTTVEFKKSAEANMDKTLDLSGATITLEQTAPANQGDNA